MLMTIGRRNYGSLSSVTFFFQSLDWTEMCDKVINVFKGKRRKTLITFTLNIIRTNGDMLIKWIHFLMINSQVMKRIINHHRKCGWKGGRFLCARKYQKEQLFSFFVKQPTSLISSPSPFLPVILILTSHFHRQLDGWAASDGAIKQLFLRSVSVSALFQRVHYSKRKEPGTRREPRLRLSHTEGVCARLFLYPHPPRYPCFLRSSSSVSCCCCCFAEKLPWSETWWDNYSESLFKGQWGGSRLLCGLRRKKKSTIFVFYQYIVT